MKIGFIGLGIMGSRMAANLQQAGHDLVVHNRSPNKAQPLLDGGAVWAETPATLAPQVELLFTMLAHPEAVSETAIGPEGFLVHLPDGALWVDFSTVDPAFSRQMAAAAQRQGARFVDAPVAGTKAPAEKGDLLILAGGEAADIEEAQPFFDIVGRRTIHVGPVGMGVSLKMVLNLLLAEAMVAFSEGMALGQSLGISRDMLFDILLGGPVVAPFVNLKRPKIEGGDYEADFPLRWMHKDVRLATQTAHEHGVAMPAGETVKDIFALAVQHGLGDLDFSAIYRFLNEEQ